MLGSVGEGSSEQTYVHEDDDAVDISASAQSPLQRPSHLEDHCYSEYMSTCESCIHKNTLLKELSATVTELRNISKSVPISRVKRFIGAQKAAPFILTNSKVKQNTGLPNKGTFCSLFRLLKIKAERMRYWRGQKRFQQVGLKKYCRIPKKSGPPRNLSCIEEFTLVLMKLRLGLTVNFLANIFAISASTCSSIFNTWIKFFAHELKCLVFWPTKEQTRTYMPKSMRQRYPRLRCTLDCSETFIQRPRDLKLQAATWSDYKHHNTVKYLVAIVPDGLISFVSNAWGGRATDRYIMQQSGILDLIEPYDLVMADRGFTIREDLLFRQADLEIPPPSSGLQQMARASVIKTKKIANARIHVERAINRIKWFRILSTTLPLSLLLLFDDILLVCAALCNLLDPLVK